MKLSVVLTRGLPGPVFVLTFAQKNGESAFNCPVSLRGSAVMICGSTLWINLVGAQPGLAEQAVTHGVREPADMARGRQHGLMGQDGSVESDDVLSFLHVTAPPVVFQVTFDLYTQWTVVPAPVEATVDLGRLIDESSSLAQGDNLLHAFRIGIFFVSHDSAGCGGPRWKRPAGGLARN